MQDDELAIGYIRITKAGSEVGQWAVIMGTKYTRTPTCMEGSCLVHGLKKLVSLMREESDITHQIEAQLHKLEIIGPFWSTCTGIQLDRWKIYGAMTTEQPEQ